MSDNLLLPIELTKILYSEWEGQLEIIDDETQLYGKSLNGLCKVTFKNGNKYEGDFKNGLLHGKGKFIWANGIVYEGDFKNNKLEGTGTYRWTDGAVYEGQVQNGLRHGKGKLTLDVCMYEGEWRNGFRHGHGKITFSNGGVYEGEFEGGVKSGKGRMYYPSGNYYEGEWNQDAKNGQGTMRWMDSHEKYTGQWLNNLQHGFGTHIWLDGRGQGKYMRNRYQGEWKAGLRDGFGVFYYANGSKYEGEWRQNMKQGTALFTNEFGNISKVQFSKDRLLKQDGRSTSQIEEKSKTGFVYNNKEIEANPYTKMLNLRELYLPQQPNLQQIYNLLLRNNSQIKNWYKNLSIVYDSKSELTFSLTLQGVWKIVRNLRVLGKISLARIDRALSEVKLNLKNAVETLKDIKQTIPILDIKYIVESANLASFGDSLDNLSNKQQRSIELEQQTNIHDGQKIILLKDFALLLVIIAMMSNSQSQPYKSIQKCLEKIGPIFDSMAKNERKSLGQSKSQNISTLSKSEKSIPLYARTINVNLFNHLTESTKFQYKSDMEDRTVNFMTLLQLFRESNLFNDTTDPAMLQRFLDKNMDPDYLASPVPFETKLNPKFALAANYELIEYEFVELLFYYLIKKLPSTKETEENKQKYTEFINKISAAYDRLEYQGKNYAHQNRNVRLLHSSKAKEKEKLLERRKMINQIRHQQDVQRREKERQQKERMLMESNDVNIMSEHFESEDDEYSEY